MGEREEGEYVVDDAMTVGKFHAKKCCSAFTSEKNTVVLLLWSIKETITTMRKHRIFVKKEEKSYSQYPMFSLSASNVTVSSFWSESRSSERCNPEISISLQLTVTIRSEPNSGEPSQPMAEKQ